MMERKERWLPVWCGCQGRICRMIADDAIDKEKWEERYFLCICDLQFESFVNVTSCRPLFTESQNPNVKILAGNGENVNLWFKVSGMFKYSSVTN
jgi:hypothetical protein